MKYRGVCIGAWLPAACLAQTISKPMHSKAPPSVPAIHIAGSFNDGSRSTACYWKNGVKKPLRAPGSAQANAIQVWRGTVYVAGTWDRGSRGRACYWVNGRRIDLPGGDTETGYACAQSLHVSNGRVYVAGRYSDGGPSIACYWVDGKKTDLPGSGGAGAEGIFIADGTVHVAGYCDDITMSTGCPPGSIGCYWVNGSLIKLPGGSVEGTVAKSVFVSEGVVYTAGYCNNFAAKGACYWVNGRKSRLPGDDFPASVKSICVSSGVLYAAGFYSDYGQNGKSIACCWSGGETGSRIDLPADGEASANSIFVAKGRIYTAGSYNNGTANVACYWMDKKRIDLPDGTQANGIFVQ